MDTQLLMSDLRRTADEFIKLVSGFNDEHFNTQPFEGSWTPAQVADHILKATGGLPDGRTEKAERPIDQFVAPLEALFLNFGEKYKSPDFVTPDAGPFEKSRILIALEETKENNIVVASTRDLSALCAEFEFPTIGYLTRYEWFKFFVVHMKRHIYQLANMMAAINYQPTTMDSRRY